MDKITRHWTLLTILILALGAAWMWVTARYFTPQDARSVIQAHTGFTAPNFTLTTAAGDALSLADFSGKPVIINFWASWCLPCRAEMPALQQVFSEYADQQLVILAVNAAHQDTTEAALKLAEETAITFPILWDLDGSVNDAYQVNALPTTFFIGKDGVIQDVVIGGPISPALLRTRVEKLLNSN
mgnify:CR=1 FL=1